MDDTSLSTDMQDKKEVEDTVFLLINNNKNSHYLCTSEE